MAKRSQLQFFKPDGSEYGGELLKTRKGRSRGRPLSTKHTMHIVLRSKKAIGKWSFLYGKNPQKIARIIDKFSAKYGVKVFDFANSGNHIHMQIKLTIRRTYFKFICAITSAIAMAVTGISRWSKDNKASGDTTGDKSARVGKAKGEKREALNFWDRRPFTRFAVGKKAFQVLRDYIAMNRWEAAGFDRKTSRTIVQVNKVGEKYWNST